MHLFYIYLIGYSIAFICISTTIYKLDKQNKKDKERLEEQYRKIK